MGIDSLIALAEKEKIKYTENEAMAVHTSFKIGGEAELLLCPETTEQLKLLLNCVTAENIPCFILGKGTNLIVSDKGIEGAVISTACLDGIYLEGEDRIYAEAGISLATLCTFARDNGLTGLEFAYGIPGSVGGALYMNAGAYGGDMSQVVLSAESISSNGEIQKRTVNQLELGYRNSIFKNNGEIITGVTFKLAKGKREEISAAMDTIINKRKTSQPLEFPSAGSTFKRPEGYFAAALIEECGLKGLSVGGAMVSEKHAGFVINAGKATCNDVLSLMDKIKSTVMDKKGVQLQPEIIFVGKK